MLVISIQYTFDTFGKDCILTSPNLQLTVLASAPHLLYCRRTQIHVPTVLSGSDRQEMQVCRDVSSLVVQELTQCPQRKLQSFHVKAASV